MRLNKADRTLLCPFWLVEIEQRWPFKAEQRQTAAQTRRASNASNPAEARRRPAAPQQVKMPALVAEQEGISITQHLRHPKQERHNFSANLKLSAALPI